jgi:HD-like signal output (HDOD) protein
MNEQKTRVMFVDDDPNILQSLKRFLHPQRDRWEMSFVSSGEAALSQMEKSPAQVIVADMRMPGMNGAELLAHLKDKYPTTVRLILSGHADRNLILQCVGTAHQFLCKPCNPADLCCAIDRARSFNASVKSQRIRELIAKMEYLPSIPSLFQDMTEELQEDEPNLEAVGAIIAKDIALTAKLLKLVNSAFFGLSRQVSSPTEAVSFLGFQTIKDLVLTVKAFASFEGHQAGPISFPGLWNHSLQVAAAAREIAAAQCGGRRLMEESFTAGMLHDIGKLALAANLPEQYATVFEAAKKLGLSLHATEEAAFGAHHADIGGYLLSLWGLPAQVVSAISLHHEPCCQSSNEFTPLAAVHIGDALVHECEAPTTQFLNWTFIEELGLVDHIPLWRVQFSSHVP